MAMIHHSAGYDLSRKKILVTGAAGFIGSALIHALNEEGYENIIACDYLAEDERWKNLAPLKFHDYLEADRLLELGRERSAFFKSIQTVFHLGACSSTTEKNARYLIHNNFEYTKLLCYVTKENHGRFVYASSAATYGDGTKGMNDREENLHCFLPLNMYAYSKHLFDCYAWRNGFLKQIIGLKYFNVFGPNEDHKGDMRSLVNKAYHQVQEHGKIELFKSYHPDYEDGKQMRDFLYVKDAIQMTLHLAKRSHSGGLYNIGSGTAHTWMDMAEAIFQACGMPPRIEFIDMPAPLRDKYQYYTCAIIDRLKKSGYEEKITPLAEAVEDYIQNYLSKGQRLSHSR